MAQYLPLPDGNSVKIREGESPAQAWARAQQMYPESFGGKKEASVKRDTTGFKAAAAAGFEQLGGEFELLKGKLGLKDQAAAQKEYEAAQQRARERFTPTEKGWTEDPLLKFRETLGGSVPYMAAPAAAGLAALAAPVSVPVAAGLGLVGAGAVSAGQFTGTNLARQMDTGKTLEQADLGKAFAAAVPQALLDTAAMALLPGVGKLFGSVGSKLTTEQAKAIASQTLTKTLGDYAAKTGGAMSREGFTEAAQQALERVQAGLNIADPEARKEYIDSFIGGAVLGGTLAPAGRFMERSAAKDQAARAEQEEKAAARKAQLLQQEQERAAAEAERNTPDYALRIADEYDAAQQKHDQLKAQIHKGAPNKPLTEEQKAFNREINKQLGELQPSLTELATEKNRVAQSGLLAQAQEQKRREALSPMDYMLEGTQEVPESTVAPAAADTALEDFGLAMPEVVTPTMRRQEETARQEEVPAAYAAERMQLARDQQIDPTGADFVEYLMADPYKASLIVETRTPLPGLTASESSLIRNSLASRLKKEGKAELAVRQDELKAQVPGKEAANPMDQFLADQDMLDVARQEGMTESDIAAVERMSRMQRSVIDQGELFPSEQRVGQMAGVQPVDLQAKLDGLNRQLQVAYVQRNADRGGQYRETIRGLIEQIRDLQDNMQLPSIGELGAQTAGLQEQLGQLPEALKAQRDAAVELEKNLQGLALSKDESQVRGVLDNLVAGIKAVRGELRPETITQIEQQAQPVLDMVARYGGEAVPGALQQLEAIGQRWRAGTERVGQTFTRTATPTETSVDMLREQMDRAFAQNDMSTRTERRERYPAQDMALLNQIADNFNAFVANPDRRNLAGEWLNRLTTTGMSSPEMTRDLQNELARLEEGKRSETETPMRQTAFGLATKPTERVQQLELPSSVMPKAVAPQAETRVVDGKVQYVSPEDVGPLQGSPAERYTPAKKATTFSTSEEFQKFLASDAVKQLRQEAGLTKDTASRMHQRMELFRKKYENIVKIARARMEVLNERKQALEKLKGQEQRVAKELLADAQIRLNNVQARLDEELQALQIAYLEADLQASQSAADAAALSQQIADNVAKFEQADAKAVAAAKATADAKAELAKIMKQPVSKKTFSAMRKAQQAVVAALQAQRSASAGVPRMVSFLNEDLRLQLELAQALEKKEADARALVEAGQILRTEAAKQKRRQLYKKEFLTAQRNLAAALELSGTELRKITGSIDAELVQIDKDIAAASATASAGEEKLAPKEAPKSAFEQKLAEIKIEPLTRAERDAITARDKAKLEAFQDTTARLAAIPGTRIDFTKRQQMLEAFNAHADQEAQLTQDLKDVDTAIEEMEIAREIAADALADDTAGYTPTQKEQFQARIKQANERIEQLTAYGKRLEAQQVSMQKAYEKAALATSSDPEIYQQVTKDLDARVEKLNKDIAENEARIAKGEAKSGKKAESKTLKQARKRLANYKRELKRVEALRSNRLGIQRIDVLTGETVAGQIAAEKRAEQGKAEPQKRIDIQTQEQIDAEKDRAEKYSDRTARLLKLQQAQAALESAKEPKTAAKKAERAEKLRKLQEDINKQMDLVNEVRPKGMGKVTAAARVQSSAPGKFRTGTQESKDTAGATKQPIVEKREAAAPTTAQAVEDANDFADRLERAKDRTTLLEEAADKSLAQQAAILAALDNNVRRYAREVDKLETERDTLQAAVDSAKEKETRIPATTVERLKDVREQLASYNQALTRAQAAKADVEAAQEAAPTLEGENVSTIEGTEMGVAPEEDFYDNDLGDVVFRTTKKTGPTMQAQAIERLVKRVVEGWKNAPEIVVVNSERDLPVRILNQVERDKMFGKLPGLYDPKSKKVYLVASNLHDANDVIATVAHEAAGHFGLQSMLGSAYSNMMRSIYANNSGVRSKAKDKMKANPNLSQDVAVEEVLADMAEGDLSPVEQKFMSRVYDMVRNLLRKLFGKEAVMTDNEVRQIVANARSFVIEGGVAGEGKAQTGEATYRTAKESDNALTELSRKIIAQPKTFTQELRDLKALELEMAGVDARAALDEVLKRGAFLKNDDRDYKQAMYLVRKRDDLMSQMQSVMENGPPEMFRDEKGFLGVRTSGKDSALDLYRAVDKIPAKSSQDKFSIASTYLAALRAADKGLEKLDVGALGVKQADLDAALAAAKADPEMRTALDDVAKRYKAYNTGLVKFLADTGAIPKKMADELLRGNYIPFYRVRANGMAELVFSDRMVFTVGDIRNQPYLAELKGGEEKIMPLNESLPRNTLLLMDKALTNLAERNVAYALQDMGKGKGPVDPRTGKPKDLMTINKETSKASPDDARVIRFNQEPDPRDPKDDGRRWLMVEADGTAIEGVPAELVVKSLEGASLPLPGFLKLAGAASDLLRTGVTRTPLYIARQLYKEPMAATFTGGLNYTPFRAVLEAGKEYVRMMRGTSETQAKLIEKGLVQSQIFSGSPDDIKKVALQLARGGDQSTINKLFGALDRAAINADAATRALIYDNARKNGLSEVEAEHMARESMNFSKRGSNAAVQYASRLIPFLNAQIQGLNVLIKAARGRMPFEEQLRIKRKFQNNAMLLFATGLVYAMAMEDDEYFKNARPRDKYTNFFLHLPGVEEPIKIATPFEAGYFFSLAVAAVDGMRRETNNAEQFAALRDMFLSSIPGYSSAGVPQLVKPVFEVFTNKNFLTGAPIESLRLRNMETADRYTESTTELAKAISRAAPILSPVQIEHIVRGYLGIAPIAAAAMINGVVPTPERGERPTTRASELPFFGSAFQRKMGGAQADEVYDLAEASFQARQSYNERLKTGRAEEAKEFREERKVELAMASQAGQYRQVIGRLNADIRRTQNRTDLTGDEKRARLDMLEQAKLDAANRFLQRYREVENRLGD